MILSREAFDKVFIQHGADDNYNALNYVIAEFLPDMSALSQIHFLSQCAYESGYFKTIEENLNYSAKRLLEVFPSKFTPEKAKEYEHQPEKIANYVYANKNGNGDVESGDGWRYRGKGYIQVTGRSNYIESYKAAEIIMNSDIAAKIIMAAYVSLSWWIKNNMDKVAVAPDLICCAAVTKRVNGSVKTAPLRFEIFTKAWDEVGK